jgi:DNA-binding beta-propeller fold protein YncE
LPSRRLAGKRRSLAWPDQLSALADSELLHRSIKPGFDRPHREHPAIAISAYERPTAASSTSCASRRGQLDTRSVERRSPPIRGFSYQAVVDPVTSILYVGNFDNADLSPINTATCNSLDTAGRPGLPPEIVVSSEPTAPALDADNHTIYVSNNGDGTLSLVATGP